MTTGRWIALTAVLCAVIAAAGARIVQQDTELAARPLREQATESHVVKGPSKTTVAKKRTIPQADGKAPILEETFTTKEFDGETVDRSSLLKETPITAADSRNRILWAETSPLAYKAVTLGAAFQMGKAFDLSAGWAFYGAAETRPRIRLGFHF